MTTQTVRRFYFYAAAFIGLQILAAGLRALIAVLLEYVFWSTSIGDPQQEIGRLSFSVAMLVVGLALWALHWTFVQRGRARVEEQRSTLRRLYLYAVLLIAAISLMFAGRTLLSGLFQATTTGPGELAQAIASVLINGAIWFYHWRVATGDRLVIEATGGPATLRRWYLVLVQAFGLSIAAYAAVDILHQLIMLLWEPPIGASTIPRISIAGLIAGLALWLPHHLWGQRLIRDQSPLRADEARSVLRQVYAAFAITFSAVAALGGLYVILGAALLAMLGSTDWSSVLREHPTAAATIIVALPLWHFHRVLLAEQARLTGLAASIETAQRIIGYLTAAIGLVALFFGLGGLLSTLLRLLLAPAALGLGWREPLSANLALSITALPVYALAARKVEQLAHSSPIEERTLARRVYLYAALLFGIITTIVAVVQLLRLILAAVLGLVEPDFGVEIGRWLGYTAIGAAIGFSHLLLVRRIGGAPEAGASLTLAVVSEEERRASLGASLGKELPEATLHIVTLGQPTELAAALQDADAVIMTLAAALDRGTADALTGFKGQRLLLATPTPDYTVVGSGRNDDALVRDAVRRLQPTPPHDTPPAPAAAEPA